MADIDLADLMKHKQETPSEQTTAVVEVIPEKEIATLTKKVESLTPEEKKRVEEIKEGIDMMNSSTALTYGAPAQKEIAEFSNAILDSVRVKDSGPAGELLGQLVGHVKEFDAKADGKSSWLDKIPFIGSAKRKAENMMIEYGKVNTQIERIQGGLEQSKMQLMEDITMFDKMYEKNLSYFKELQLYIQAGEEKLEEMRTSTLPRLKQQAQSSGDPMAVQVVADFEQSVDRFEKKIHDLKISKTLAIQTAPQIRLIQNNDRVLIDRVQTAIYHTIPLWKNQIVLALGLSRQRETLQMQKELSDATNELLKRNAEMLKMNTIETARENERGIVDIETVKKVNEDLISSLEETVRIQQEGRQKRQAAEKELLAIENRLQTALLQNGARLNPGKSDVPRLE